MAQAAGWSLHRHPEGAPATEGSGGGNVRLGCQVAGTANTTAEQAAANVFEIGGNLFRVEEVSMSHRRKLVAPFFVLLFIGFVNFFNIASKPRFETFHRVDVLQ